MTTTEISTTWTLTDALASAGDGGSIRRSGATYAVNKTGDNTWTLDGLLVNSSWAPHDWEVTGVASVTQDLECVNCNLTWWSHNDMDCQVNRELTGTHWLISGQAGEFGTDVTVPVAQTYDEWFSSLEIYTYITDGYSEFIFCGFFLQGDDEVRTARILSSRWLEESLWSGTDLEQAKYDTWVTVKDDADDVKRADRMLQRALRSLVNNKDQVQADSRRIAKLEAENAALMQDYRTVNHHINAYADEMRMCPDYEARIFSWNDGVNGRDPLSNKLVGRSATYYVYLTVPTLSEHEVCVDVMATSPEDATTIVQNLPTAELLAKVAATGYRLNDMAVNVRTARR